MIDDPTPPPPPEALIYKHPDIIGDATPLPPKVKRSHSKKEREALEAARYGSWTPALMQEMDDKFCEMMRNSKDWAMEQRRLANLHA